MGARRVQVPFEEVLGSLGRGLGPFLRRGLFSRSGPGGGHIMRGPKNGLKMIIVVWRNRWNGCSEWEGTSDLPAAGVRNPTSQRVRASGRRAPDVGGTE